MKTVETISLGLRSKQLKHTEAWGKDGDVEVSGKLLHFCRKHALAGYNVARQADTNHLQDGFEDKHSEMR